MILERIPQHNRMRLSTWILSVAGLVGLLSLAAGVDRAQGHAGEVHTEPAPQAQSTAPESANPMPEKKEGRPEEASSVGDGGSEGAPTSPPPPVEPDTDPTLHFIALGLILVLGAGFLLVRRRRTLA